MAEKLAASSSQRFGLISLRFARSIGFLGKRLNDLIFGERSGKGKAEKENGKEKRENEKKRCDRFWGSPYGDEGSRGTVSSLYYLFPGKDCHFHRPSRLNKNQFFVSIFHVNLLREIDVTLQWLHWEAVSENVNLT